jgi:prepilin-type N-terminal cleavage/methylation domain-containing protein
MFSQSQSSANTTRTKGFTLIELLIVVAIIAILAAIAVPNFLEAQTRAKVSRVKADQRSIATALESYAVDWNRHPNGYREMQQKVLDEQGAAAVEKHWVYKMNSYKALTTPIAYLTSVPFSPFYIYAPGKNPANNPPDNYIDALKFHEYTHYDGYLAQKAQEIMASGVGGRAPIWAMCAWGARINGHAWSLASPGPMGNRQAAAYAPIVLGSLRYDTPGRNWAFAMDFIYDPTNGTASGGNIFRSSAGIITTIAPYNVSLSTMGPVT